MALVSHTSGVAAKRITLLGTPISFYRLDQLARKFNISFGSMAHCLSALITAVVSLLFMYNGTHGFSRLI